MPFDSEPKFKERKVAYKDVLKEAKRFEQVLEVDLGNLGKIGPAIQVRHDIVHRNGRAKDGSQIDVASSQILDLLTEIGELAKRVENKLDFGIYTFPDFC